MTNIDRVDTMMAALRGLWLEPARMALALGINANTARSACYVLEGRGRLRWRFNAAGRLVYQHT